MKKLFVFLFFNLLVTQLFSYSVRSGEIAYTHMEGFTYEVNVTVYTNDSPIDSIELSWGDGSHDTLANVGLDSGSIIHVSEFSGIHTFPGTGIYVISSTINYLMEDIANIHPGNDYPFYLEDTLSIPDPQFFGYNNSCLVLNPPVISGHSNTVLSYNPDFYDPDGDSLSFSLVPFFAPGYSDPAATTFIGVNEMTGEFIWNEPTEGGNYAVAILAKEWRLGSVIGTSLLEMVITIEDSLLSIHGIPNSFSISIFPNPAKDVLNINIKNFQNKNARIEIINSRGEKVFDNAYHLAQLTLDISSLPTGFYGLQLVSGDYLLLKNFMKQ